MTTASDPETGAPTATGTHPTQRTDVATSAPPEPHVHAGSTNRAVPDDELDGPQIESEPEGADAATSARRTQLVAIARGGVRWVMVLGAAAAVFAVFLVGRGADPIEVFQAMWRSSLGDWRAVGETLLTAAPILLAALAVAVPARAGMFNIGGEGQLVLGAVGATGMGYAVGTALPAAPTLVLLALGGAAAGAAWAAIPAVLKLFTATHEAITSLLLNYVAFILLAWLVFEPWRDPNSTGQAYSTALEGSQRLPILWGNRVNLGIVIAVVAVPLVWWAFNRSRWGFRLRVLGGNPEAARRAGFSTRWDAFSAFAIGGALAGLGGMVAVAGVEARLRPDLLLGVGYTAFLASWLGRHDPPKVLVASVALAAILVGGTGLRIAAGLSGAAVNVLMALVLLAVLGWSTKGKS